MKYVKLIFGLIIASVITNSANAMEVRTLDKDCNYIERNNGSTLTYREVLTEALNTYENVSTDTNKQEVAHVLRQAIELFGKGERDRKTFEREYTIHRFNYTNFKSCKDSFLTCITKKGFPFHYQSTEAARQYVYNLKFYDIDHALEGILQFNAYQTTGGDS